MPAIYKRRFWNDADTKLFLDEGKTTVDVMQMSDGEFRRYILWRLGLAEGSEEQPDSALSIPSAQANQLASKVGTQSGGGIPTLDKNAIQDQLNLLRRRSREALVEEIAAEVINRSSPRKVREYSERRIRTR